MDWSMGGYGFYVWGSYICTFVAIGLEVFSLIRRKRSCGQIAEIKPRTTSHSHQASDTVMNQHHEVSTTSR